MKFIVVSKVHAVYCSELLMFVGGKFSICKKCGHSYCRGQLCINMFWRIR